MDFTLTQAQQDLGALAREILTDQCTQQRLREIEAGGPVRSAAVGRAGEGRRAGGRAAGVSRRRRARPARAVHACSTEIGRAVAPVPYLATIVLGAAALARFGTPSSRTGGRRRRRAAS